VNVKQGKFHFDFTYKPQQDEEIILNLESIKSTLIGCHDSDIGLLFSLYHQDEDGKINFSSFKGLGPSPTPLKMNTLYVVRVTLILEKSCIGMLYYFGIQRPH
jgi:hypothetical protein